MPQRQGRDEGGPDPIAIAGLVVAVAGVVVAAWAGLTWWPFEGGSSERSTADHIAAPVDPDPSEPDEGSRPSSSSRRSSTSTSTEPTATTSTSTSTTTASPEATTTTEAAPTTVPPPPPEPSQMYLSDEDPVDSNRLYKEGSITIGGNVYSRSPMFRICQAQGGTPGKYTYLAGGKYTRFDATIGLADDAQSWQQAEMSVLVDGVVAWEGLMTPGRSKELTLNITGAFHVSLEAVHIEPKGSVCSVAYHYDVGFGDARLTK